MVRLIEDFILAYSSREVRVHRGEARPQERKGESSLLSHAKVVEKASSKPEAVLVIFFGLLTSSQIKARRCIIDYERSALALANPTSSYNFI